jgi:hypothetical protein
MPLSTSRFQRDDEERGLFFTFFSNATMGLSPPGSIRQFFYTLPVPVIPTILFFLLDFQIYFWALQSVDKFFQALYSLVDIFGRFQGALWIFLSFVVCK